MNKLLSKKELYSENIIGVKVTKQEREYAPTIGTSMIVKSIRRTSYLKVCWMCGLTFESHKISTIACSPRCSQNIWHTRKLGLNPPANMAVLVKERNTKDIREQLEYR